MVFSEHGIQPDPEKVKSLKDVDIPKDKREVLCITFYYVVS